MVLNYKDVVHDQLNDVGYRLCMLEDQSESMYNFSKALNNIGVTAAEAIDSFSSISQAIKELGERLTITEIRVDQLDELRPALEEKTETPKQKSRLEFFDPNCGYNAKDIYKDVIELECSKDNIFIY